MRIITLLCLLGCGDHGNVEKKASSEARASEASPTNDADRKRDELGWERRFAAAAHELREGGR